MRRIDEIVKGYREGAPSERMDIYLEHPPLRGLLDEIEREGGRGAPRAPADGAMPWLRRLRLACAGRTPGRTS